MTGMYAKIGVQACTTLPPPCTEERVQYSILNTALLSAASTTPPAQPASSAERSQQTIEEVETVKERDVHPLG